ncbi:arylamine N-acetyltransferase family protein [Micromonospora coerulea]|uniref:arylamine N-acetyltransferase family protein n=1 Tax=Micromonospora coerulea TaxID=47856 RepID=UPI0019071C7F|nr:arylamine N-acetyltransferase [Micromonospora veneta]
MTVISPTSTPIPALTVPADPRADVAGYLGRLGLERPARPDVAWLFAAHRAHRERIPYDTLEIHLERPTTVDPVESIARIVRGGGGYCFHLNGAFGTLLACLGYEVTRHIGDVRGPGPDEDAPGLDINHQVLVVRCEGETWFVDLGLVDAPHEPMPLRAAVSQQGPFTYRLEPWAARAGGWRFVHDVRGVFSSMVFAPEPVSIEAFAAAHRHLSTSPDSGFVRKLTFGRQDERGVDMLRGRVLERLDAAGRTPRILDSQGEWFAVLADVFGLRLPDVDRDARARLWVRVSAAHEQWVAAQTDQVA